jgi:hypothetical protein
MTANVRGASGRQQTGIIHLDDRFQAASLADRLTSFDPFQPSDPANSMPESRPPKEKLTSP